MYNRKIWGIKWCTVIDACSFIHFIVLIAAEILLFILSWHPLTEHCRATVPQNPTYWGNLLLPTWIQPFLTSWKYSHPCYDHETDAFLCSGFEGHLNAHTLLGNITVHLPLDVSHLLKFEMKWHVHTVCYTQVLHSMKHLNQTCLNVLQIEVLTF